MKARAAVWVIPGPSHMKFWDLGWDGTLQNLPGMGWDGIKKWMGWDGMG